MDDPVKDLLGAALPHVAFDGWTEATFRAAVADAGIEPGLARALCPRGALDLAAAYHRDADARMVARLKAADLGAMRYRDRVAAGVRFRLEEIPDKEAVRRAVALFALPQNAVEGTRLIWHTVGLIWETLGDTSDDINWYSKRAILSGVYTSTVLFWLGDQTPGHQATWEFLDRRIGEVMEFEKVKAKVRESALGKAFMAGPGKLLDLVRAPGAARTDVPGRWR